jgi:hypothetical protein
MQAMSPFDFRPSIEIPFEWANVATMDQTSIQNAVFSGTVVREDLVSVGSTGTFNLSYLKIKPSLKLPLPVAKPVRELPIDRDPEIAKIAATEPTYPLRVFASAKILAAVVASSRSVQPFHLIFDKRGKDLYVLSRDEETDPAVVETNIETITTTTPGAFRDRMQLQFRDNTLEATAVNAAFVEFARDWKAEIALGAPSPFAAVYRRLVIDQIEFVVRCPAAGRGLAYV